MREHRNALAAILCDVFFHRDLKTRHLACVCSIKRRDSSKSEPSFTWIDTTNHWGYYECSIHCFTCKKNLNNIDLLLTLDYDFLAAVTLLERWLDQYQARQAGKKPPSAPK
jgi:hypothetical protein